MAPAQFDPQYSSIDVSSIISSIYPSQTGTWLPESITILPAAVNVTNPSTNTSSTLWYKQPKIPIFICGLFLYSFTSLLFMLCMWANGYLGVRMRVRRQQQAQRNNEARLQRQTERNYWANLQQSRRRARLRSPVWDFGTRFTFRPTPSEEALQQHIEYSQAATDAAFAQLNHALLERNRIVPRTPPTSRERRVRAFEIAMESARIRAAMIGGALSAPSPQDPTPTSTSVTPSTSGVAISTTCPNDRSAWVGKPERDRKEKERRERALELAAQWAEEEIEREYERALEEEAERIRLAIGRVGVY